MRPPGGPDATEPTPVQRGVLGAIAGLSAALLVVALGHAPGAPPSALTVLLVTVPGLAVGAAAAVVAGSRELRGAVAHSLMGALVGVGAGCFAGAVAVLVAIGRRWDLGVVFFAPIALGATLGALVARARHGGRVTVGELMAWVAALALVLALAGTARRL